MATHNPGQSMVPAKNCLDGLAVFRELPEAERHALVARSVVSTHAKGEVLAHPGDAITAVMVVISGKLKTYRTDADGEEYLLDVLHDGEAIWHAIFREDHVYHCVVEALSKVEVCRVPRDNFYQLIDSHPAMAKGLISTIGASLVEAEDRIMTLGIRDPRRRLAGYLLERDRLCIGPEINLRLEDIASSVGLRPETVSRTLGAFERDGLIRRLGRGKLRVCDRPALQGVAELS